MNLLVLSANSISHFKNEKETAGEMRPAIGYFYYRKWSSTPSDPHCRPQMIPWKVEEWNGF